MEPQYLSVRVIRAEAPDALNAHLLNVRHGVSEKEEESVINLVYPPYLTLLNVKLVKAGSTRQVGNCDLIFRPPLKKGLFPVQQVLKSVAIRAAAKFDFVEEIISFEKKKENAICLIMISQTNQSHITIR